jgi:hypothetical protein
VVTSGRTGQKLLCPAPNDRKISMDNQKKETPKSRIPKITETKPIVVQTGALFIGALTPSNAPTCRP